VESLHAEVAPFGINTTIVNPGFFRRSCSQSNRRTSRSPLSRTTTSVGKQLEFWKGQNGQQTGDPAKLARALITIAGQEPPPRRFIAGADAIATAEQKIADLKEQIEANRKLSTSLAFD
jgi:NAD(P)-dependent dehydrogenase (short-subunit alcohol dehydrogenase family)